jgi:hypothetical protein
MASLRVIVLAFPFRGIKLARIEATIIKVNQVFIFVI